MAEIYNSINPNKIKIDYTSSGKSNDLTYDSNYLNINTWYFGIDVNRPYGPSSGTGWYQGINNGTIDDGLYTIYYTGTTIGNTGNSNDKYRCVQYSDPQDVINFVNDITHGFPTFSSLPDALNWFKDDSYGTSGSSGKGGRGSNVCVNMDYPNIPTSGLTFAVDAGHVASYPWTNPTWYDFTQSAMSGFSGNSRIISHFNEPNLFFNFTDAGVVHFEYFTSSRQENLGQDFTIIFWAAPINVADTDTHSVYSVRSNSRSNYVGIYDRKSSINFYFTVRDTTDGLKTRQGNTDYLSGVWAQFSYVFETNSSGTTTTSFYYNDTLSEQNDESYLVESWNSDIGEGWNIGQIASAQVLQNNYHGGMQVLLVYNRALSATEISDIYLNYRQGRVLFE